MKTAGFGSVGRRRAGRRARATTLLLAGGLLVAGAGAGDAATMYSTRKSFMGAGTFWGPGPIEETPLFDAVIPNIGLATALTFVTPFHNNGGAEPNICGERELGGQPRGTLSDGVTRLNELVDACAFDLNGIRMLVGVVDGGPHQGRQTAAVLDDGTMIMTMDFALDMGIGKSGVILIQFYGTSGEVTIPQSLQTQLGIEGGVDRAGKLASGSKLRGRLGDFNQNGMLDGAVVVAGNIPLESIFMPGAPYALIRYFETDIPYSGKLVGKLPKWNAGGGGEEPPPLRIEPPPAGSGPSSPSEARSHQP